MYRIQHLLGVENYPTWSVKIMDILTDLNIDGYPLGKKPLPVLATSTPVTQADIDEWHKKDRQGNPTSCCRWTTCLDQKFHNIEISMGYS